MHELAYQVGAEIISRAHDLIQWQLARRHSYGASDIRLALSSVSW